VAYKTGKKVKTLAMDITEKPCAENETSMEPPRRSFLMGSLLAIIGGAVSLILAIPLVRFSMYPLRQSGEDADWSDVGPVDEFTGLKEPVARTITIERRDAWRSTSSQTAVYVLPAQAGQFRILSPVCPHLGCSIRWINAQNRFICPCHNGTFTAEGEYISGPPRRSMDALDAKVADGVLKVRYKSFRQLIAAKEEVA
jgi:menaquinol-cytochrome c reductase iron-sulfur subunit